MEILKAKKTNFDPTPSKTKRKPSKKFPSAETVDSSDKEDGDEDDEEEED